MKVAARFVARQAVQNPLAEKRVKARGRRHWSFALSPRCISPPFQCSSYLRTVLFTGRLEVFACSAAALERTSRPPRRAILDSSSIAGMNRPECLMAGAS